MNWLAEVAALALEPRERDLVLGDLAECGVSGPRAFFEVLGLVARRQVLIWTNWRPWFALIGVAGISGFYLSRMFAGLSVKIFEQISAWRFGVHYNVGVTSFRDDVTQMCCLAAAIFCWTAVNASVLRRFSGRAIWLTGLLFYFVVHRSAMAWAIFSGAAVIRGNPPWWTFLRPALPLYLYPVSVCFFLIPAICGARRKFPAMIPLTVVCTIAAALLGEYHAHDLERLSGGAFRPGLWPAIIAPYVLASWPVFFARSGQPRRG
jgi:hypothetical protein